MKQYKVSVIVPVYNAEKYIDKCIQSVQNQTLKSIQIILINDGSNDSSKEKCELWTQKNDDIQLINKENEGAGATRNLGIEKAKGKYIFFLDADDYLPNDALEILYTHMINTNSDMICGTSMSVFKDGTSKRYTKIMNEKKYEGTGKQIIEKTKYKDIPPMVWLYMYKKSFLVDNHIVFPVGVYHEDCEFCLKTYYYAKKITFIDNTTYCQFISDNSIMRSKNIKKSKDAIKIAKDIEEFTNNEVREKNIKKVFYKYIAYLYSYSIHYALQIDENFNDIITAEEKKHIIQILRKNIKYLPLSIAMKFSLLKLYKKFYKKYNHQ